MNLEITVPTFTTELWLILPSGKGKIMTLTVIVPDDRQGMRRMLARELQNIDNEILYTNWRSGLKKAQGDFILLLERDSGITRGGVDRLLFPLLDSPHYRKLAMVSPMIEFDDSTRLAFRYVNDDPDNSTTYHLARVGSLAGSIIRKSSLKKHSNHIKKDITSGSYNLSLSFWESGLRVMLDPNSTYYSPLSIGRVPYKPPKPTEATQTLWLQECIA